jgi:hypothetical protein
VSSWCLCFHPLVVLALFPRTFPQSPPAMRPHPWRPYVGLGFRKKNGGEMLPWAEGSVPG